MKILLMFPGFVLVAVGGCLLLFGLPANKYGDTVREMLTKRYFWVSLICVIIGAVLIFQGL